MPQRFVQVIACRSLYCSASKPLCSGFLATSGFFHMQTDNLNILREYVTAGSH